MKTIEELNKELYNASKNNNLEMANFLKLVIDIRNSSKNNKNNKQNTLLIF